MKRMSIKYGFPFLIFSTAAIFQSCDYVNNPIENVAPADTTTSTTQRNVLVEDYTGHKCTACPQAAIVANNLIQSYGKKVVVIAVHAGFFSTPATSGTNYLADFRTTAGNAYNTFFGFTVYPSGLVNRKDYTSSTITHIKPHGSWSSITAAELTKPALAKIDISNTYDNTSRALTCTVKSTFLYDTLTGGPYKLIVALTQDSIIATQLNGSVIVPNYVHQHVLRDNLNGTWGENIATTPVTKNVAITKTYNYTIPNTYPISGGINSTACVVKHCHIVAFLYNDVTKEVIQVEQKNIIP